MKRRSAVIPTKASTRRPRVQRVPVLVVLHPDGWIEVYGDDLDVCIMTKLDGGDIPAVEVMAEQYMDLDLPRRFRPLYFPVKLRATGQCERRTPAAELQRLRELRLVRKLREVCTK
jgi:hypothetical protein